MSEMIERVARALCSPCENPDRQGPFMTDDGRRVREGQAAWQAWKDDARAAIEAMREVDSNTLMTAGPIIAGYDAVRQHREWWASVIDAALRQEPTD